MRSAKNSFQLRVAVDTAGRIGTSQLAFDQNLDHALRGAAQRERILRAGGNQADAEAAAQRIELVGDATDLAGCVRGIESSMLSGL